MTARSKKTPRHLVLRQQMKDQEALRVLCASAAIVASEAKKRAESLPEDKGRWPTNWLASVIRHLEMAIQYVDENRI